MLEKIWYDQIFVLPLCHSKGQPCMCINISPTIYFFVNIWWEIHKLIVWRTFHVPSKASSIRSYNYLNAGRFCRNLIASSMWLWFNIQNHSIKIYAFIEEPLAIIRMNEVYERLNIEQETYQFFIII